MRSSTVASAVAAAAVAMASSPLVGAVSYVSSSPTQIPAGENPLFNGRPVKLTLSTTEVSGDGDTTHEILHDFYYDNDNKRVLVVKTNQFGTSSYSMSVGDQMFSYETFNPRIYESLIGGGKFSLVADQPYVFLHNADGSIDEAGAVAMGVEPLVLNQEGVDAVLADIAEMLQPEFCTVHSIDSSMWNHQVDLVESVSNPDGSTVWRYLASNESDVIELVQNADGSISFIGGVVKAIEDYDPNVVFALPEKCFDGFVMKLEDPPSGNVVVPGAPGGTFQDDFQLPSDAADGWENLQKQKLQSPLAETMADEADIQLQQDRENRAAEPELQSHGQNCPWWLASWTATTNPTWQSRFPGIRVCDKYPGMWTNRQAVGHLGWDEFKGVRIAGTNWAGLTNEFSMSYSGNNEGYWNHCTAEPMRFKAPQSLTNPTQRHWNWHDGWAPVIGYHQVYPDYPSGFSSFSATPPRPADRHTFATDASIVNLLPDTNFGSVKANILLPGNDDYKVFSSWLPLELPNSGPNAQHLSYCRAVPKIMTQLYRFGYVGHWDDSPYQYMNKGLQATILYTGFDNKAELRGDQSVGLADYKVNFPALVPQDTDYWLLQKLRSMDPNGIGHPFPAVDLIGTEWYQTIPSGDRVTRQHDWCPIGYMGKQKTCTCNAIAHIRSTRLGPRTLFDPNITPSKSTKCWNLQFNYCYQFNNLSHTKCLDWRWKWESKTSRRYMPGAAEGYRLWSSVARYDATPAVCARLRMPASTWMNGPMWNFIGDGICDHRSSPWVNTDEWGYDGGDCCKETNWRVQAGLLTGEALRTTYFNCLQPACDKFRGGPTEIPDNTTGTTVGPIYNPYI